MIVIYGIYHICWYNLVMVDDFAETYVNQLHDNDAKILEELTTPRHWEYDRFKKVMVSLARTSKGNHTPAINRPDSINIQNLRKYVDNLMGKTKISRLEYGQTVFADTQRESFVVSKTIKEGSNDEVDLIWDYEPGRKFFQKRTLSFHTHPQGEGYVVNGFSDTDYSGFMNDLEQQAMLIAYGDEVLMVMKTSVTPNNLSKESTKRRIKECSQDFYFDSGKPSKQAIVDFNKEICIELGLVLYRADAQDKNVMRRVPVTK
jgi:hypothetical protein